MLQRLDRYSWSSWKKTSLNEWGSFLWKGRRCHTSTSLDSHLGKRIFYRKEIAGNKAGTSFGWAAAAGRRSEMSISPDPGHATTATKTGIAAWELSKIGSEEDFLGTRHWRELSCCVTATVLWWRGTVCAAAANIHSANKILSDIKLSRRFMSFSMKIRYIVAYRKHRQRQSMKWNSHNLSTLLYSMSMMLDNQFFPEKWSKEALL